MICFLIFISSKWYRENNKRLILKSSLLTSPHISAILYSDSRKPAAVSFRTAKLRLPDRFYLDTDI